MEGGVQRPLLSNLPVFVGWVPSRDVYAALDEVNDSLAALSSEFEAFLGVVDGKVNVLDGKLDVLEGVIIAQLVLTCISLFITLYKRW